MQRIINARWQDAMSELRNGEVNLIITSPPYNTNKKTGAFKSNGSSFPYVRYDMPMDNISNEQYTEEMLRLFAEFDRVLDKDGCVVWNMNYGANNTELLFTFISDVIRRTNFTVADVICWRKKNAVPNNMSHNRLTRVWEPIFVFCRKSERNTFSTNKKIVSLRSNGQKTYQNIPNFIEARNNDGSCSLNKATFSTELVEKLIDIYGVGDCVILDPFGGTGTTANACVKRDLQFVLFEISPKQCEYAASRVGVIVETLY